MFHLGLAWHQTQCLYAEEPRSCPWKMSLFTNGLFRGLISLDCLVYVMDMVELVLLNLLAKYCHKLLLAYCQIPSEGRRFYHNAMLQMSLEKHFLKQKHP
nr:hypothetical protein Iba_chr13bCG2740 [Ipomoea batatas]GMD77355.1 hypothetical protein Iba_chr13cCG2520 [Ipomoea batatas]GMD95108.1 hypothetical protein Iba_chr15aCG9110 [Ipomoea batatas]